MTSRRGADRRAPTPEQLAAYADGELDGRPELAPLKRLVKDWLADHPEAAAEVEAQRHLARLWRASTPPDPGEPTWAEALARLDRLPLGRPERVPARPFRLVAWAAGVVAACAAAGGLGVAFLSRPGGTAVAPQQGAAHQGQRATEAPPRPAPPVEPFPVATADEVEILSVKGDDTGTLVVGILPVRGLMELVQAGEVEITRGEPEMRTGGGPMIWTPLDSEATDPDDR